MNKYVNSSNLKAFITTLITKYSGTVLYDNNVVEFPNASVSTATLPITLTQSCLNYNLLEIQAITNDNIFISQKIMAPTAGKRFILKASYLAGETSSTSYVYYKLLDCIISNDGLAINSASNTCQGQFQKPNAAGINASAGYYIAITKIVGYNI